MTLRQGVAWHGDQVIGAWRETDNHEFRFAYDDGWLDQGGFPLSILLPLSKGNQEMEASAFFTGLLPEGAARRRICQQRGLPFNDDAGLLLAIGEDCAGALSVLPPGKPPQAQRITPKTLPPGALEQLARSAGADDSYARREQRFSLAGTQEKQSVVYDGCAYALPDRSSPSSHILKFETAPGACFAEYIALDMARRLDLPAAPAEYLRAGEQGEGAPYLRIERYDRQRNSGGECAKLHQEDLLQALGEPLPSKYQRGGGPSLRRLAQVLRENTARPVEAISKIRDWQICNYLIGNWDGHAKNLALLYGPNQAAPVLAPFYDLAATDFLNLEQPGARPRELAFSIGAEHAPERVTRADWERLAEDLGLRPPRLLARLEELALRLPDIAGQALQAFMEQHGDKSLHHRLGELIGDRCRGILNSALTTGPKPLLGGATP